MDKEKFFNLIEETINERAKQIEKYISEKVKEEPKRLDYLLEWSLYRYSISDSNTRSIYEYVQSVVNDYKEFPHVVPRDTVFGVDKVTYVLAHNERSFKNDESYLIFLKRLYYANMVRAIYLMFSPSFPSRYPKMMGKRESLWETTNRALKKGSFSDLENWKSRHAKVDKEMYLEELSKMEQVYDIFEFNNDLKKVEHYSNRILQFWKYYFELVDTLYTK